MEIIFWSGTIILGLAQYKNHYLVWHKQFGPAQNISGPVEGRGIRFCFLERIRWKFADKLSKSFLLKFGSENKLQN